VFILSPPGPMQYISCSCGTIEPVCAKSPVKHQSTKLTNICWSIFKERRFSSMCTPGCHHHLHHPWSNKIHNGGILVQPYPDYPGKWPLNIKHCSFLGNVAETEQVRAVCVFPYMYVWLGGRLVRTADLRSKGRGFESQLPRCLVQPWASC